MNRREFVTLAAGLPLTWRRSLVARRPAALVTCDSEARLALVDLGSFSVLGHVPTLPDPRAIERVGRYAVVCHTAIGAVSIVEGSRVRQVLRGFREPRYTAAHPNGRHAFVTDSRRSSVVVIDVVRGLVLGRVALPGWARHITIDATGSQLWVGLGSAAQHVAVVATNPLRHVATLTPGFGAHDVGHAPDGRLWVTAGVSRELAVAATLHDAEPGPQHVTFGPDRAYVTSGEAGVLRVQSLSGRVLRSTPIPFGSYNVQHGPGRVITPSLGDGTLAVLDEHGALLARVPVADSCHDACFWSG